MWKYKEKNNESEESTKNYETMCENLKKLLLKLQMFIPEVLKCVIEKYVNNININIE